MPFPTPPVVLIYERQHQESACHIIIHTHTHTHTAVE